MPITDLQRKALIFLVDEAKGRQWVVPTAKELAFHLYNVEEPRSSDVTAAQQIINRLQKNYQCFIQQGPKLKLIDKEALVTDPPSAHYVLTLRQLCRKNPNRCTTKEELHRTLVEEFQQVYSPALLEKMFGHARRGKYIAAEEDDTLLPGQLRLGQRVEELLPYLQDLDSRPKL